MTMDLEVFTFIRHLAEYKAIKLMIADPDTDPEALDGLERSLAHRRSYLKAYGEAVADG